MDLSLFLAQLLGLMYIVTGVGIFANKGRFRALYEEMLGNAPLIYLMGILSLVFGFVVVTFHNQWVSDWTVLITIIGWLGLIKGILIIVSPRTIIQSARFWLQRMQLLSVVVLAIGLVLGYFGFMA